MTLTLYRVNTAGQGLGNLDANEQIIFNNTTNVNLHNAFVTGVDITNTTGIGNNQAAEQDLGDHQDLGSVEQLYIIRGFISVRDQTPAATNYIDILKKWDDEVKTNTNFVHGRMGIAIDDFAQYNIVPDGVGSEQVGLIWKSIKWGTLEFDINPLRADFVITMIVDKGDDQ
jgi:hypothetical protein